MKKKYIREGGICRFWDIWAKGGQIDMQKLGDYIMNPPPIERSIPTSAAMAMAIAKAEEKKVITDKEEVKDIPFSHNYKIYGNEKN